EGLFHSSLLASRGRGIGSDEKLVRRDEQGIHQTRALCLLDAPRSLCTSVKRGGRGVVDEALRFEVVFYLLENEKECNEN
ncbi:MAG TPA: hypothetical protein PK671_15555, partial [Candidatus Obscuribacter sp.]|nr:hypothetical protein [Candidatus Obscuribacter sp.]